MKAKQPIPARTPAETRCPNGCGRLFAMSAEGLSFLRCVTCAGIYVTPKLLKELASLPVSEITHIDELVTPAQPAIARAARRSVDPRDCPRCHTLMLPYTVQCKSMVTLDRCGVCEGVWADDHELAAASIPINDEARVHYDHRLSAVIRNEVTVAIFDAAEDDEERNRPEDIIAQVFPTFASWVRTAELKPA